MTTCKSLNSVIDFVETFENNSCFTFVLDHNLYFKYANDYSKSEISVFYSCLNEHITDVMNNRPADIIAFRNNFIKHALFNYNDICYMSIAKHYSNKPIMLTIKILKNQDKPLGIIANGYYINDICQNLSHSHNIKNNNNNLIKFTTREHEVIYLKLQGKSNADIARILSGVYNREFSRFTINSILQNQIYVKMDVFTQVEFINKAPTFNISKQIPPSLIAKDVLIQIY